MRMLDLLRNCPKLLDVISLIAIKTLQLASITFIACGVIGVECAESEDYNGYSDGGAVDGVVATIEYKTTTIIDHISVWAGIDDGVPVQWYQSGWRQSAGQQPEIYHEYTDSQSVPLIIIGGVPPSSGDYSVARNESNVDYVAGNLMIGSVPWVETYYCWAQFKVELKDESGGDRIPGSSTDPLEFSDCQKRRKNSNSWQPASLSSVTESAHGVVGKSGNSFTVYDDRS